MASINERITALRKQHKLSQTELAKRIGVSRTIIGNYEHGENTPSTETIIKLAKAFNVSVDSLFGEGGTAKCYTAVLKKMQNIEQLDQDTCSNLFFLIDNVVQNLKKRTYAN